ncbi:hypothetical protein Tco_0366149 [Tanacetum coccineum]
MGCSKYISPVTQQKYQAVEKEKKAKNILLMAIPRRPYEKKLHKAFSNNRVKHLKVSSTERVIKGYDRFQQLTFSVGCSWCWKYQQRMPIIIFLRSLPAAWLNQAMTKRTKPEIDNCTCTPSTSSTNISKKEVLAGFADEVIYSLFAKQSEDWDLLYEDLEQIDDVDIEDMDINWQIAMIAINRRISLRKTEMRVRVEEKH